MRKRKFYSLYFSTSVIWPKTSQPKYQNILKYIVINCIFQLNYVPFRRSHIRALWDIHSHEDTLILLQLWLTLKKFFPVIEMRLIFSFERQSSGKIIQHVGWIEMGH